MNQLQIFSNPEFGEIRTVEINKKPYFVGNDIAKALEYARPYEAISTHCKGAVTYRVPTKGGEQAVKVIPEGDVYRLIVKASEQSKSIKIKEKAEHFESWIFDTILPSIRKNGMYATDELLDNPDLLIQVATRLKEEKERNQALQTEVAEKEKKIEEMKPKALFADAVATSKTSILIGDLAKILKQNGVETGAKRLFNWLRENEYLIKRKGTDYNMPTQKAMDMGLFEVKESTINNPDGSVRISRTTKVTGKGQQYFVNKFLQKAS